MRLWNIGAEGQLLLGAWAASAVVLVPLLPGRHARRSSCFRVMLVAGLPGRRGVGPHPGRPAGPVRRQRDHRHADAQQHRLRLDPVLGVRAVDRGRVPAAPSSSPRRPGCPACSDLAEAVPAFRGLTVHAGLPGRAVARRGRRGGSSSGARWGYEIRLIGDNPRAARYAGIPIARIILLVFAVSGGLAGIAGMAEVSGCRPPAPGQLLARLRLHGDHRRVPREVPSAAGRPGGDPVRGAGPRRPRDPAVRGARDDPGDHPVLPDRERGLPPLPRRHRVAACRPATVARPTGEA